MSERVEQMRRRRRRRQKEIPPLFIGGALIAVVLIAIVISIVVEKYKPSKERMELTEVFGVNGEETALYLNQDRMESFGICRNGAVYIRLEEAAEYLNRRFYYNSDGDIRYMLPEEVVRIMPGSTSVTANGNTTDLGHEAFFAEGETVYLSLSLVEMFSDIKVETYMEPNRAFITTEFGERKTAEVKSGASMRYRGGIKSPILLDIAAGERVEILEDLDDWQEVFWQGCIGYVRTKDLREAEEWIETAPNRTPEFSSLSREYDICLAWHQVFSAGDNENLASFLEGTVGINVLSPTWYSLSDNAGNFTSLASSAYVEEAHQRGIEVWGLLDDFSSEIDLYTILSSCASREALVRNLIAAAGEVGLDGINIDFEHITENCGPHFVEFFRELSVECRKAGLVLSIDNFVPAGGRAWVDRAEQGSVVDYVIVMSYDEHWNGGPRAGSTASFDFSQSGILDTIAAGVPAEKVINGVPFFTRIWVETPEAEAEPGSEIIQDANSIYGRYALSSTAAGMTAAANLLAEHGVTPRWLEEEQQYYGEYEEGGRTTRVWLEDVRSLEVKMAAIRDNEIAGAAFWKLGLEDTSVWEVIGDYLN